MLQEGSSYNLKQSDMDGSDGEAVQFQIVMVDNRTFYASVIGKNRTIHDLNLSQKRPYDDEGALYYVVAVLCIYAFSIILMIGSVIKKSKHDNGVTKYMKGMDRIRRMERREQKFKIRVAVLGRTNSQRPAKIKLDLTQTQSEPLTTKAGISFAPSVNKISPLVENQFEMQQLGTKDNDTPADELCSNTKPTEGQSRQQNITAETDTLKCTEQDRLTIENECSMDLDSFASMVNNPPLPASIESNGDRITLLNARMDTLPEVDEEFV